MTTKTLTQPPIAGRDIETKLQNIARSIRTAEADFERAALQRENGEIGDEELANADAAIRMLRAREKALLGARAERDRQDEAKSRAAEAAARSAASRQVEKDAAVIDREFKAAVDAIAAIGPRLTAVMEARQRIMATAGAHRDVFAPQELGELSRVMLSDKNRERQVLESALHHAGFKDYGIGREQAVPAGHEHGLVFVMQAISQILSRLSRKGDD